MRAFLFALMLFGCGDTDCPDAVQDHESCSSAGLACEYGSLSCQCRNGEWECADHPPDLSHPVGD